MMTQLSGMATGAQVSYLQSLLATRECPEVARESLTTRLDEGSVTKQQASDAIAWLKVQPRRATPAPTGSSTAAPVNTDPVTEEGVYEHDGKIYKVQRSKSSGHLYAKVLSVTIPEAQRLTALGETVNFDYVYAPGAFREINASNRMTPERAEALSIVYTWCIRCGRALKRAESVKAGMGPVCRNKV